MNDHSTVAEAIAPTAEALFSPLQLGSVTLPNRMAVAPMTRISASPDGRASERMASYYASFAEGGFGLVITEGSYTDKAHSQGYLNQPGLTDAEQVDAWGLVVDQVHAAGGKIIAQLMHAGALSQGNPFRDHTVGPSAVQPKGQQMTFYHGSGPYPLPREMTQDDIDIAVAGFAEAAANAKAAGFDGVEIHGANGYLLDEFLTEGVNVRTDRYGGDAAQRLRLISEVVKAVRLAVGDAYLMGVRISQAKVNDYEHKWSAGEAEAEVIFGALGRLPIDYLHTTEFEAWQPAFAEGGPSLAALASRYSGLTVLANGSLHDPGRAAEMAFRGHADIVTLGRGALTHADWPTRVRSKLGLEQFDGDILSPIADLANADRKRRGHKVDIA